MLKRRGLAHSIQGRVLDFNSGLASATTQLFGLGQLLDTFGPHFSHP